MPDLTDSGTARFIVLLPKDIRFHVEILTVIVDAVLLDQFADLVAEPFERLRVPQIEQVGIRPGIQHPLGMLLGPLGAFDNPLGFEPYHKLGPDLVRFVGNRLQSVGEFLAIDRPVAHRIGPVLMILVVGRLRIPSGIEPKYFRYDVELLVTPDQRDRIIGCQAGVFVAWRRVAIVETRRFGEMGGLAIHLRRMMRHHEPTEPVVSDHPVVAFPEQQADARRADRLLRIEVRIEVFHARGQRHAAVGLTGDIGEPRSRPTDGHHHALPCGRLDVEERKSHLRRTSALRGHVQRIARRKHLGALVEIVLRNMASVSVMQDEIALLRVFEIEIDHFDLRNGRGIGLRIVLKIQDPFDRIEIGKTFHPAFNLKSGRTIQVRIQVFDRLRFVGFDAGGRVFPLFQQLAGRFSVVNEGERRNFPFGEMRLDPTGHIERLIGHGGFGLSGNELREHRQRKQ